MVAVGEGPFAPLAVMVLGPGNPDIIGSEVHRHLGRGRDVLEETLVARGRVRADVYIVEVLPIAGGRVAVL